MSSMPVFRPAKGRRVLRPDGDPLPDEGEAVVMSPYWRRLLRDGDIEPVPKSKSAKSDPKNQPSSQTQGSKSE